MADVCLNIGAGNTTLDGFEPIDIKNGQQAFPLDRPDESVDEIYASHQLEHFSYRLIPDVLKDWVRVLKPGGRLRIAVPDFSKIARAYIEGEPINTQGYVMGGHVHEHDHHGALFDRESLAELMLGAGLEQIHEWESEIQDSATLPISLNLAGFKPISDVTRCHNTVAVLSAPRYGSMLHMRVSADAFHAARVRYIVTQGVYWHQVLCEMLESLLTHVKPTYIITVDYDTIFTAADVLTLYRLMEIFPEADAICGMQSKRQSTTEVLCNLRDPRGGSTPRVEVPTLELLSKQLTPIMSGHFGLTMFRSKVLAEHPRPWMLPEPNKDQRWGDHRRDADMDFWRRWYEAGRTAFMATHVVLGHIEEVIAWPGDELKPIYQHVREFAQSGKPVNAWPQCLQKCDRTQTDPPSDCLEDGGERSVAR